MTSVLSGGLHRRRGRTRVEGGAASLLGVEHEYSLRDAGGPVDFRLLLHRLPVAGLRLDPGDPNAYRCSFGGAMTCDGAEAEVASPPIPGQPGFARAIDAWARTARAELERVLPSGVLADGYSTHLNTALLRRARGGTITAQEHLEASWEIARAALAGYADPADLRDADRMVAGDLPLPLECDDPAEDDIAAAALDRSTAAVLVARSRPGFTVRVEIATWDFTVFALGAPMRTAYLCMPRAGLSDFLVELDRGIHDAEINRFLIAAVRGRVLASAEQTTVPGLYDRIGQPSDLLPRERAPFTGRPLGGGGSGARGDRPGKRETQSAKRPRGRWIAAAAAAVTVVVVAVAAAALAGGGGDSDGQNAEAGTDQVRKSGATTGVPRAGPNFEPHGTTKGTIAYTQDGTYPVTQAITVTPANVRPGDTVAVTTFSTSVGPSWVRAPDGQFRTVCDAGVTSDFSRSSTSIAFLSPVARSADALVGGLSSGGTPPGAVGADVQLGGSEFRETSQGCDRTATADSRASMTVPLTIRPGRYALIPSWGIYAEFPGQRNQLAHTGGRYPVLTVVRT